MAVRRAVLPQPVAVSTGVERQSFVIVARFAASFPADGTLEPLPSSFGTAAAVCREIRSVVHKKSGVLWFCGSLHVSKVASFARALASFCQRGTNNALTRSDRGTVRSRIEF